MPSIQDVADQINAKLDEIETNTDKTADNTEDIKDELVEVNAELDAIDANLANGFANLSQGLFLLSELEKVEIGLLDHNRKQNDTIICLLEHTNELLCGITRKLTVQLDLSRASLASQKRMEAILSRAHAAEAADYDRHLALQRQIEECCPPEPPPLEACPEDCPTPQFKSIDIRGTDWKPLPTPKLDEPK